MKITTRLIFVLLFLIMPWYAIAQSGFSGAYIGRFTTQQRAVNQGDTDQAMRLYNRIILRYEPTKNFAIRTALRRADFFQEKVGNTHFYYGYLNWEPLSTLHLMVGRQYPYNKMIRRAIDGASAEWALFPRLSVEGLAGIFAPADREGFAKNPDDEHGSYLALHYQGPEAASVRASVYQQVSDGRIINFTGLDARYVDFFHTDLYGFFKYNFTDNVVQEAEAQARHEFGERLAATVSLRYRDPNFDLPPWYWQFAVDPYSTVRFGVDYWATNTGSVTAEYFSRVLNDGAIQRYRLGWLATDWSLGVVYADDNRNGSNEWNAYGSLQHHFGKTLLVGAGVNYFDYVLHEEYEEPLNAYGAQLFVKYRVLDALTAGVRGYYLINPEYSEDVRLLGELSYQF